MASTASEHGPSGATEAGIGIEIELTFILFFSLSLLDYMYWLARLEAAIWEDNA